MHKTREDGVEPVEFERPGHFSVKLTSLSVVLLVITVSSLATLVVVTTITKVDTLSTVALALAVLSFAAQLIVTLAQGQTAANQTRDTFRVNAETRAVLAKIQTSTDRLIDIQASQFQQLLDRVITPDAVSSAIESASEDGDVAGDSQLDHRDVDASIVASRLRENAKTIYEFELSNDGRLVSHSPIDEPSLMLSRLRGLTDGAKTLIRGFIESKASADYSWPIETPAADELMRAEFVTLAGAGDGTAPVFRPAAALIFIRHISRSQPKSTARSKLQRRANLILWGAEGPPWTKNASSPH